MNLDDFSNGPSMMKAWQRLSQAAPLRGGSLLVTMGRCRNQVHTFRGKLRKRDSLLSELTPGVALRYHGSSKVCDLRARVQQVFKRENKLRRCTQPVRNSQTESKSLACSRTMSWLGSPFLQAARQLLVECLEYI